MSGEGEFDPLKTYAREKLLARLRALSVSEADCDDVVPEARCRAKLTVALGRALGCDVSCIVDGDGQVLCRSALFSSSGQCAFGARCALSHSLPVVAHKAALARVAESQDRARELELAREAAAKAALAAPQPAWLERRRRTRVIAYDTARYGLREALAAVLELDRFVPPDAAAEACTLSDSDELSSDSLERRLQLLHTTSPDGLHGPPPLCPALSRGFALSGRALPNKWKRARFEKSATIRRLHATERWARFLQAYDAFVEEVVAPHLVRRSGQLAGSSDDEANDEAAHAERAAPAGALVYQRPPTVRVHCPGHVAPIGLHCDADYPKHEGGEINVWVPLTRSYGSNALWLESAPGSGDFAPVELPYGSALVFNGCRCRHYAMPNATGATRVSFDLRAIPAEVWRDDYNRKIGDYDASVCAPGGNEALVDAEPS